jgi:tetratricopeptide (TPR) repeat protein
MSDRGEPVPVEQLSDRGFALLELREWDEALAVARELEERRFSAAFDIAAQAHAGLGDLEAAVAVLERGVGLAPGAWANWQLLGNYRSDLERYDEAAEAYERALGCPGVWEGSVRLNQAVLEGRRGRFEEMLAHLEAVEDDDLALVVAEHRVHGLAELGRNEEAEEAGLAAIEGPFDPGTEGPTKARIAARVGALRRTRGDDPEEVRRFAHASLRLDGASPAILALIRELDDERSPAARYWRLVADARIAPEDPRHAELRGYFVTYDVVADSPEEALGYVRAFEEFFPEGKPAAWSVSEFVDMEPRPDDPKGVYWRTGRSAHEDEESCEMRGEEG